MDESWRFCELTPEDAAAIVGWRYGGRYAFYDTAADPEFAAAHWWTGEPGVD